MPNLLAIVAPLYECFVEGMKLDNVNIHGATLAALLQAVASSPGPCDGLLFGHVARHCHSKFSDSLEAIEVEEVVANVTSFLACSSSMSFYDGAGDVREHELKALLGGPSSCAAGGALLGFFSHRPVAAAAGPLEPSMREAAVTAALHGARQQLLREAPAAAAAAGGQQPGSPPALGATLLALLAQQPDHGGATLSMTYRFHQLLPPGPSRTGLPHTHQLQPLPCAILNLHTTGSRAAEGAGSQGAYDSFRPAMRLPAIPALSPCAQPGSAGGLLHHLARSAAEAGTALEGYLQAVLQQMAQLGRQVCSGDAALQSLRQDNAALLARVAERHAAASWSNKRQQGEDEQAAAVASKPASGTTALPQPSTQQQQAAVVHASLPPTQQPNANQNILPDLI